MLCYTHFHSYVSGVGNVTRMNLYTRFIDKQSSLALSQMLTYFQDLRNSGIRVHDLWHQAWVDYNELWLRMTEDTSLYAYYDIVYEDFIKVSLSYDIYSICTPLLTLFRMIYCTFSTYNIGRPFYFNYIFLLNLYFALYNFE